MKPQLKLGPQVRPGLAPQQQLFFRLLCLPVSALREYLEEQAEENPVLEITGPEEVVLPASQPEPERADSFRELLKEELRLKVDSSEIVEAGDYLIENLEEDGFLKLSLEELAEAGGYPVKRMRQALKAVQSLEPAGVAARDFQELFLLQLERKKARGSLPYGIIKHCWKEFCQGNEREIARRLKRPVSEVKQALQELLCLRVHPLSGYLRNSYHRTLQVDGLVRYQDGRLRVSLCENYMPVLWVNPEYLKLARDLTVPGQQRRFLKAKISEAETLILAVEQWKVTHQRIFEEIVFSQESYWRGGMIRSLTEQEIATRTGFHVSTVSRAVAGKYLATPRGIVPVRHLLSRCSAGQLSQAGLKEMIRRLLSSETRPLSDRQLAQKLGEMGVSVAVRTVNKYRTRLQVPNSYQRQ